MEVVVTGKQDILTVIICQGTLENLMPVVLRFVSIVTNHCFMGIQTIRSS